jgi:hexosaminidase
MKSLNFPQHIMPASLIRDCNWVLIVLTGWSLFCCSSTPSKPQLELIWKLERNFEAEGYNVHTSTFWLVNRGQQTLADKDWAIYWNQPPFYVARTESEKPVSLRRINGDFYELKPGRGFSLAPGDSLKISYTLAGSIIKHSDAPQGVYVAYTLNDREEAEQIRYFKVLPFETREQLTRSVDDVEPIPTAEYLYDQNAGIKVLPESEWYPVLPSPKKYLPAAGQFHLASPVSVSAFKGLENELRFLEQELKDQFNVQIAQDDPGSFQLLISKEIRNAEGYRLSVDRKGIRIEGGSASGVFYGIRSLLSLIRKEGSDWMVKACVVEDEPAFAYRGLHLDVGRNFQKKETVLRLIDLMAKYKLNKFLLYVTEDEGWRLEINSFPELTEVGGRRGHRHRDSLYLQPAYGSGPDADEPTSYGNGFYTRDDFMEIIRYAYDRHVDVIPEINLPGHARAAIRAMELRYNRLMKEGKTEEALKYRLIDPDDGSVYNSAQGYNDNVACVCQDAVYRFFEVALDDIIEMYRAAGVPLTMMHTGGDEVPGKAWSDSPVCREFLKRHPEIKNTRNLQAYFFDRITDIIRSRGLPVGAWEEAVMSYDDQDNWYPNKQFTGREVYPYIWNILWGNQDLGYKLANAGYPVVLCNVTNFYFDLAYDKDPREPGLYWAGFVDTKDAFSFVPYNLFISTTHDDMGRPFNPEVDFAGMERLTPKGRANIVGVQAQIWSETINRGQEMLEYYALPKLLGFAQRAWQGQPSWAEIRDEKQRSESFEKDWNRFVSTVGLRELPALDDYQNGYHYRIPAPGIRWNEEGRVEMNARYPGFEIRYTTDGSEPDHRSTLYAAPVSVNNATVKAACFNRKGRSGFSTIFLTK